MNKQVFEITDRPDNYNEPRYALVDPDFYQDKITTARQVLQATGASLIRFNYVGNQADCGLLEEYQGFAEGAPENVIECDDGSFYILVDEDSFQATWCGPHLYVNSHFAWLRWEEKHGDGILTVYLN